MLVFILEISYHFLDFNGSSNGKKDLRLHLLKSERKIDGSDQLQ